MLLGRPLRACRIVKARGVICRAVDVPRADDAVAIGHAKVQQASGVDILVVYGALGDLVDQVVDVGDGLQHSLPQHGRTEAFLGRRAGVMAHAFERVQEQGKRPFAVGASFYTQVPFVGQSLCQTALDISPTAKPAIVHPHKTTMLERVAIVRRGRALGGSANVCENEMRGSAGCDSLKVGVVPRGRGRGENARFGPQFGVCVVAYPEAIGVVLAPPRVLPTSRTV